MALADGKGVPGAVVPGALTAAGGTPMYMAPEQLQGETRNASTDQYSFSVSFFLALFGRHPSDEHENSRGAAGGLGPAPAGGAPSALVGALLRGASRHAAQRYPSMSALLAALASAAGNSSQSRRRWRPWLYAAGALGLLAFLVAANRGWLVAGAVCGDSLVAADEECDDGNAGDGDACAPGCRWARCGDGHVWHPVEECDDGNQENADGCTALCRRCNERDPERFLVPEMGRCYVLHRTPAPWIAARSTCAQQGQALVTYGSPMEGQMVQAAFSPQTWIGLRRERTNRSYLWVTGQPLAPAIEKMSAPLDVEGLPAPSCVFQSYEPLAGPGSPS